ncbi:sigma-70 family RNA polymerase sigma factor [Saccharopolyspora phatthalungensis]|uniref:RNA polymerase sigma-70 factor (ECF subfamily) n=1 Tax=Saccharopolyspora phatthalungensis TaxID=664693 RepID=A0A840QFH4_9PSEU|nr:sigma-70 family RNA polymerase sigma factor [Saccharopolyspora phatthalungensis]MBB5159186.1 RNA polymerase sigma-70 factor (ECF subfamily) [Saccharopolyspora phatthalungensis]
MARLRSHPIQTAGDDALIRSLFAEHGRALLAYATRLTGDRAAAEDVVQETLLRAWRNPGAMVNGKGSVRGWLLTVARNIVIDRSRAKSARPAEVAENPTAPPTVRDHADTVVDSMVVTEALNGLSDSHRDVLVQIYFRGLSVAEAARELAIPPGTVKSRTYHALRALRDAFGGGQLATEEVAG